MQHQVTARNRNVNAKSGGVRAREGRAVCVPQANGQAMSPFAKINGEIRSCLDRIESGGPALAQLADTLDRLNSDPSWSAREIREVEGRVRRILSKIVIPEKKGREPRGQVSSPPLSIPSADA